MVLNRAQDLSRIFIILFAFLPLTCLSYLGEANDQRILSSLTDATPKRVAVIGKIPY